MRDHVGEFAAVSENADKKIVLASFGAGEQTLATFPISPKSNPIGPGQLRPRVPARIPMQDDGVLRRSLHRRLPSLGRRYTTGEMRSHGRAGRRLTKK